MTEPFFTHAFFERYQLLTLQIDKNKQVFFEEILENFDFVEVLDNEIWEKNSKQENMQEEKKQPQTFSEFTFQQVLETFELESQEQDLFATVAPLVLDDWLNKAIKIAKKKRLRNEKERSECLINPILISLEERNDFSFRIFSGEYITINKEKGLKGEFDFAFVNNPKATELIAPIFTLVEAKQGDITKHWGQIAAQMVGAREENTSRNESIQSIFGCITSGELWRFMKLEDNCIYIDEKTYFLNELEKILGIFQYIVDFYRK